MRADELAEGDLVVLSGATWEVVSAVAKRDQVMLTIVNSARRTYSKAVPAERTFDASRPRMSESRRAEVWAEANGVSTDGATAIQDILGGVELYRTIGGVTTVQTPDATTLAAHLLLFHGTTWAGVSMEDARRHGSTPVGLDKNGKRGAASFDEPVAERTTTPAAAIEAADYAGMVALHERLHALGAMPVAHVHADLKESA